MGIGGITTAMKLKTAA